MSKREVELAADALDAAELHKFAASVRDHIVETDRFTKRVDETLLHAYKAFEYILDKVGPISDVSSAEATEIANACAFMLKKISHDIIVPAKSYMEVVRRPPRLTIDDLNPDAMKGAEDGFGGSDFPDVTL